MNLRFAVVCAAALTTLGGVASSADAQIVTITKSEYTVGPPAVVTLEGTWSVPKGTTFRIVRDFGVLDAGVFTPDATIAAERVIHNGVNVQNPLNGTWSNAGDVEPKNIPARNFAVRVRLQVSDGMGGWNAADRVYSPVRQSVVVPVKP